MSANRAIGSLVCGLALINGGVVVAAEDEKPDMDFLEYLGMWEESDEEWLVLDKVTLAENEKRSDPASEDEASLEKEDESEIITYTGRAAVIRYGCGAGQWH